MAHFLNDVPQQTEAAFLSTPLPHLGSLISRYQTIQRRHLFGPRVHQDNGTRPVYIPPVLRHKLVVHTSPTGFSYTVLEPIIRRKTRASRTVSAIPEATVNTRVQSKHPRSWYVELARDNYRSFGPCFETIDGRTLGRPNLSTDSGVLLFHSQYPAALQRLLARDPVPAVPTTGASLCSISSPLPLWIRDRIERGIPAHTPIHPPTGGRK